MFEKNNRQLFDLIEEYDRARQHIYILKLVIQWSYLYLYLYHLVNNLKPQPKDPLEFLIHSTVIAVLIGGKYSPYYFIHLNKYFYLLFDTIYKINNILFNMEPLKFFF
jgi:hypothetical protein